jgi:hypothetical protein
MTANDALIQALDALVEAQKEGKEFTAFVLVADVGEQILLAGSGEEAALALLQEGSYILTVDNIDSDVVH